MNSSRQEQHRGRLLVIAAAVLWSTSAFFGQAPLLETWPLAVRGTSVACWRALFGGLLLVPLIRRPCWTWRLVPAALCFAAMNLSFLQTLTRTSGANAIWLQYTAPLWVLLVSAFWLGDPITRGDIWMLACGMLGVLTIVGFETHAALESGGDLAGIAWGLAAGVGYAAVILTARGLRDVDAAWLMGLNHLATALLMAPYVVATGIRPTGAQLLWLAAFGGLQMGLPYMLFTRGVRHIKAYEATSIALLEPLLVPLWVFLAWHDSPTYRPPAWWTFVGGAMILTGLLIRYRPRGAMPV